VQWVCADYTIVSPWNQQPVCGVEMFYLRKLVFSMFIDMWTK